MPKRAGRCCSSSFVWVRATGAEPSRCCRCCCCCFSSVAVDIVRHRCSAERLPPCCCDLSYFSLPLWCRERPATLARTEFCFAYLIDQTVKVYAALLSFCFTITFFQKSRFTGSLKVLSIHNNKHVLYKPSQSVNACTGKILMWNFVWQCNGMLD